MPLLGLEQNREQKALLELRGKKTVCLLLLASPPCFPLPPTFEALPPMLMQAGLPLCGFYDGLAGRVHDLLLSHVLTVRGWRTGALTTGCRLFF